MNTFTRTLLNLAGKTLFVIGIILILLMVMFGFWPSIIYIAILIVGATLIYIDKSTPNQQSDDEIVNKQSPLKQVLEALKKINFSTLKHVIITTIATYIAILFIGIAVIYFGKNHFNKRRTTNECEQISLELNRYFEHHHSYPTQLNEIIHSNPLNSGWQTDGWGNLYQYTSNNSSFKLISAGIDGKFHTQDDLVYENSFKRNLNP